MADTQTSEILKVRDPADEVEVLDEQVTVEPDAQIPEVLEEYVPEPRAPFEANPADVAEQHVEVPVDPEEDYR